MVRDEHIGNAAFKLKDVVGVEQLVTKRVNLVKSKPRGTDAAAAAPPCVVTLQHCSSCGNKKT